MRQFIEWWQNIPEHINPVFFKIGVVEVRYYGLMFLFSFIVTYLLILYRLNTEKTGVSKEIIKSYFGWAILAAFIGGRLGYILFYNLKYYLAHPLQTIFPFDLTEGFEYMGISGMSYHGGLLGILLASVIFCQIHRINFWRLTDLFAPAVPLGYTFGRLGNFLNGELYGRVTDSSFGMYFPLAPMHQLRHPSQLYEAFFEGIFLFLVLWSVRKIRYFDGFLFSLYLIGYGLVRFFIEFIREPDPQLGFIFGFFTMGQILCFVMLLFGISILIIKHPRRAF